MSVTLTTTISSTPLIANTAKLLKPVNQKSGNGSNNNKKSSKLSLDSQETINEEEATTEVALSNHSANGNNSNKQHKQQKALITDDDIINTTEANQEEVDKDFKPQLVWTNIVLFIILHTCIPIGAYMIWSQRPWKTVAFCEYSDAFDHNLDIRT